MRRRVISDMIDIKRVLITGGAGFMRFLENYKFRHIIGKAGSVPKQLVF